MEEKAVTLTVLYNNVPHDERLTTAWGMACLVEGTSRTVLFDTGGDGAVLLRNMALLDKDPAEVDVVVLSHIHADHTGGLLEFLERNAHVQVCVPHSFPASFVRQIRNTGAEVVTVKGPQEIASGLHTTGQIGKRIKEQALVVHSPRGLALITGCSHPGIIAMAEQAAQIDPDEKLYFITGGFHLGSSSQDEIKDIIQALRRIQVNRIAPSHCTGDLAMQMFSTAWGDDYVSLGCGAHITIRGK